MTDIIWYIIAAWNITVFTLYGIDKWKAEKNKWRLPEAALILTAFLLGGAGAIIGMVAFNHKTSKPKFKALVPIALILTITASICLAHLFGTGWSMWR